MKQRNALLLFLVLWLFVLPQALWPLEFSSLEADLQELENLINDTLQNSLLQQEQLEALKSSLEESGLLLEDYESIITQREKSLLDLQTQLAKMSEIYKTQSELSTGLERRLKNWKIFTIIAIPATALVTGTAAALIARR